MLFKTYTRFSLDKKLIHYYNYHNNNLSHMDQNQMMNVFI
jgi:hypothetical protein